jgi:prepilin-type N-terminal cleavage/methylation domain-containing protein
MEVDMRRAFTLIELLVVIAIIAILAAILFPVFAEAKNSAKKAQWINQQKQVGLGLVMYATDNDDTMVLSNTGGVGIPGWGFGRPDYVWPELVFPYVKNWALFRHPMDPNANERFLSRDPFDNPVGADDPALHYYWGERASMGLNYEFLSPWIYRWNTDGYVGSESVNMGQIQQSSSTIMTVDAIWDRDPNSGKPMGAGNWVIEPPCIFGNSFAITDLLIPVSNVSWYQGYQGWIVNPTGQAPYSWLEFGGAWPWFRKLFTVSFTDGHVSTLSLGRMTDGCDVRSNWGGLAYDGDKYLYDLR